jgi:hypothetical protein
VGRALVSSNNDNGGRVTLHVGRGVGVIAYSFCMFLVQVFCTGTVFCTYIDLTVSVAVVMFYVCILYNIFGTASYVRSAGHIYVL